MPQLTVSLDLPDETYRRVLAFNPPSRHAFEDALKSAAISAAADVEEPDFSGAPFFPARNLPEPITTEAVLELTQRVHDEEDAEIIAVSGLTRR